MELDERQRRTFHQDGYLILRRAVPRPLIDAALRVVNDWLGRGFEREKLREYRQSTFAPDVAGTPVVTGLVTATPLLSLAESLLYPGAFERPEEAQVALRFPDDPSGPRTRRPHVDATFPPFRRFTVLAGVMMSDLPAPDAGNFMVWPGSHRLYQEWARLHGPESVPARFPSDRLPPPVQVTARPGDAVLTHYLLGHSVAINASPHLRYAAYFRLHHAGHTEDRPEYATDIWREFSGLRHLGAGGASVAGTP